jgi:hypothetical protein
LQANSSANQLDKLINEHFFGKDRPACEGLFTYGDGTVINISYQQAQGSLFQNGISYEDVRQGIAGDCYYLASLATVAQKTPNLIREMFIDNGDGTYTVRFFNKGQADYVTVDRYLPTQSNGALPFAKVGGNYNNSANELWVALAEKAYAQMNEAGWLDRPTIKDPKTKENINLNGLNTYKGIEWGWVDKATAQISNKSGNWYPIQSSTSNQVVDAFNAGKLISFSSFGLNSSGQGPTKNSPVVSSHAYTMVGYNQATGQFKLFNPWGLSGGYESGDSTFKPGILEMTWNQIKTYFSQWTVNG